MTLGQVRALCHGLTVLERADQAHQLVAMRIAVNGDADAVEDYLDSLEPRPPIDPMDALIQKLTEDRDGRAIDQIPD